MSKGNDVIAIRFQAKEEFQKQKKSLIAIIFFPSSCLNIDLACARVKGKFDSV